MIPYITPHAKSWIQFVYVPEGDPLRGIGNLLPEVRDFDFSMNRQGECARCG